MITPAQIDEYLERITFAYRPTSTQLAAMVNWFAEGVVTNLNNYLHDHLAEGDGDSLQYSTAKGCRCGSCYEWQIIDAHNNVIDSADTLMEWANERPNP